MELITIVSYKKESIEVISSAHKYELLLKTAFRNNNDLRESIVLALEFESILELYVSDKYFTFGEVESDETDLKFEIDEVIVVE